MEICKNVLPNTFPQPVTSVGLIGGILHSPFSQAFETFTGLLLHLVIIFCITIMFIVRNTILSFNFAHNFFAVNKIGLKCRKMGNRLKL